MQHAQPTTLGHFLLGFAYPLARDAERLLREGRTLDASPAGSASTNGSRLPLDRERLRVLLGFPRLCVHNRDAMWQSDVPINLMAVVVSLTTTADRLAEELQIWATEEFSFVALDDAHCRTSVIMPNKKNPYALAFIRGQARELVGNLVSVIATNQTPSGQLDNRNASYELLPRALGQGRDVLRLFSDVLARAVFDAARLRAQAATGFTFGTELADLLLAREGVDARTAHEIAGATVAAHAGRTTDAATLHAALATAFVRATGRALALDGATVWDAIQPERIIATRRGTGSAAPSAVRDMVGELRSQCRALAGSLAAIETAAAFPATLRAAVAARLGRTWVAPASGR